MWTFSGSPVHHVYWFYQMSYANMFILFRYDLETGVMVLLNERCLAKQLTCMEQCPTWEAKQCTQSIQSSSFMETVESLACLQQPAASPWPEPFKSYVHLPNIFSIRSRLHWILRFPVTAKIFCLFSLYN